MIKKDRVSDLMSREVAVINGKGEVHELEKLLLEKHVHGLPVVDDDGALVGIVSQTDLINWHFSAAVDAASVRDSSDRVPGGQGQAGLRLTDIRTATIEEVMSPIVHCIGSERPIAIAASTMIRHRIHRLVVVDRDMRVQGIISALDLLHAVPGVDRLVGVPRKAARPRRPPPTTDV